MEVCMPISLFPGRTAFIVPSFSSVIPHNLVYMNIDEEEYRSDEYTWTSDGVLEKLKEFIGEGKGSYIRRSRKK